MKIKVTYSEVKKALKDGFISPLNNKIKSKVKHFDKVSLASKVNGFDIIKVIKRGTKKTFFRIEKDGAVVCSTMFSRKYNAESLALSAKSYLQQNTVVK